MSYIVTFDKAAKKQFKKLDRVIQEKVTKAIDEKLALHPNQHLVPLAWNLADLYKFRIWDYRLICQKNSDKLIVLVVKIKHRKDVYRGII